MRVILCIFMIFLAKPATAVTHVTTCERSGIEREISVTLENQLTQLGCKVHYRKPDEGRKSAKVLWHSDFEPGFCQRQAEQLVAKLKNWGWRCRQNYAQK